MILTAQDAKDIAEEASRQKDIVRWNDKWEIIMNQIEANAKLGYCNLWISTRFPDHFADRFIKAGFTLRLGPFTLPGYGMQVEFDNTEISW